MASINYVTEEGLHKLRTELDHMKNVERPAISRQIGEARDKGDLSENAEYDAAKDAQGILEMKIAKLEALLANSRIIDESKIDTSSVQMLNKVKIHNITTKTVMEYTLVPDTEANLKEGKISVGSLIAQALLGKKKGDIVEAKVPAGIMKLEILDISR